jgi:hypothetical protein
MLSAAPTRTGSPIISSNNRNLAISQVLFFCLVPMLSQAAVTLQCANEYLAIISNVTVLAAKPSGGCTISAPVESSCSFDFAPTSAAFEQACGDAGGIFYAQDRVHEDCSARDRDDGRLYDLDYYWQNVPFCFGANCTSSDTQEIIADWVDEIDEESVANGFFCSREIGGGEDDSSDASAVVGLVFLAVVVAVIVVAVWLC